MKVGFFTPHINFWPPHYETELELIQSHLNEGDEVIQFICNSELPICDNNPDHNIQTCLKCIGCRDFGKKLVDRKYIQKSILKLNSNNREEIRKISELRFSSIRELQMIKVDNFDLGYAVGSSVITKLRDPDPDLNKHREMVMNYLISSLGIFRSMCNYLAENKLDRVYTFNGRLAHVKPILRACQYMNVDCFIHERGHNKDFYSLYQNTTPHDITYVENAIKSLWISNDSKLREVKGREFYEERAKGIEKMWLSFTKEQVKGLLPEGWDERKTNIVIFNSSEDEFASVGEEWSNPIYKTQLEGIERIIRDLENVNNIHIYLRIHPNLRNVKNEDKRNLYNLKGRNFTLIPAESPISTYDLISCASKILTFGSTVGMEAVYWGKPSILAGKSFYSNLGGTYNAISHDDVLKLLQIKLSPKSIESALMYGFYLNSFGIPYKFYKAESLFNGEYKGYNVLERRNVKYKYLNWLLWKPIIRNYRSLISKIHQKYVINSRYY